MAHFNHLSNQLDVILKNVYDAGLCRELFAARGIQQPPADAIERCKRAAKDAVLRLPDGVGNMKMIQTLDDAFSEQVDREVKELKTLAR